VDESEGAVSREEETLAALARLPVGPPLTRHEADRIAECEAALARGEPGRSSAEVLDAARSRFATEARRRLMAIVRGEGDAPWSDADILRLDALCALGRPAEVVSSAPAEIETDMSERRWGTVGTRQVSTRDSTVRADVLHAWRGVGSMCGCTLPAPHDFGKGVET